MFPASPFVSAKIAQSVGIPSHSGSAMIHSSSVSAPVRDFPTLARTG